MKITTSTKVNIKLLFDLYSNIKSHNHRFFSGVKIQFAIASYLLPYIRERHYFTIWVGLIAKVEHISYTMGTRTYPWSYRPWASVSGKALVSIV